METSGDTGSEGRSLRREVAVIQPKTIGASTDKSSVRMDQMSKKWSQSNTSARGILPGKFLTMDQAKGSLPEGFFDNKYADLCARGLHPQKVDMNDAYKEFEKEIQENLQEVDDHLEEGEIDAAAEREEYVTLEQQEYRKQADMLKKQLLESEASRTAKVNSKPTGIGTESSIDSSSDEEYDSTDFAVDWRAQHLK